MEPLNDEAPRDCRAGVRLDFQRNVSIDFDVGVGHLLLSRCDTQLTGAARIVIANGLAARRRLRPKEQHARALRGGVSAADKTSLANRGASRRRREQRRVAALGDADSRGSRRLPSHRVPSLADHQCRTEPTRPFDNRVQRRHLGAWESSTIQTDSSDDNDEVRCQRDLAGEDQSRDRLKPHGRLASRRRKRNAGNAAPVSSHTRASNSGASEHAAAAPARTC